jgi:hypothetical protein
VLVPAKVVELLGVRADGVELWRIERELSTTATVPMNSSARTYCARGGRAGIAEVGPIRAERSAVALTTTRRHRQRRAVDLTDRRGPSAPSKQADCPA